MDRSNEDPLGTKKNEKDIDNTEGNIFQLEDNEEEPPNQNPSHPENKDLTHPWQLYVSRFLTAWGDRLWNFGGSLFLYKIYPDTLFAMSIYGLVNALSVFFLGPAVGAWIDNNTRLRAAGVFLVIQNTCVALNCALLGLYFHFYTDLLNSMGNNQEWLPWICVAIVILISTMSTLASHGSKIVVEKDWIVVIAAGDENHLSTLNTVFRTIDLTCLTATPFLGGFLFDYTSYEITAVVIAVWNIVSVVIEYLLLLAIYKRYSALAEKTFTPSTESSTCDWLKKKLGSQGWSAYMTHKVRDAGLGLAFTYMTVLAFDGITQGYMLMQCVPESTLGILKAVGAVIGILASFSFTKLKTWMGLEKTGLMGMVWLVVSIGVCVVSVWLPGSPFDPSVLQEGYNPFDAENKQDQSCSVKNGMDHTAVAVLIGGILVSRFGLYLADLAVLQIQQKEVEVSIRGIIGGTQASINHIMMVLRFILVLLLPRQQTFGILIILSFIFIFLGAICFISYGWNAFKQTKISSKNSNNETIV